MLVGHLGFGAELGHVQGAADLPVAAHQAVAGRGDVTADHGVKAHELAPAHELAAAGQVELAAEAQVDVSVGVHRDLVPADDPLLHGDPGATVQRRTLDVAVHRDAAGGRHVEALEDVAVDVDGPVEVDARRREVDRAHLVDLRDAHAALGVLDLAAHQRFDVGVVLVGPGHRVVELRPPGPPGLGIDADSANGAAGRPLGRRNPAGQDRLGSDAGLVAMEVVDRAVRTVQRDAFEELSQPFERGVVAVDGALAAGDHRRSAALSGVHGLEDLEHGVFVDPDQALFLGQVPQELGRLGNVTRAAGKRQRGLEAVVADLQVVRGGGGHDPSPVVSSRARASRGPRYGTPVRSEVSAGAGRFLSMIPGRGLDAAPTAG